MAKNVKKCIHIFYCNMLVVQLQLVSKKTYLPELNRSLYQKEKSPFWKKSATALLHIADVYDNGDKGLDAGWGGVIFGVTRCTCTCC